MTASLKRIVFAPLQGGLLALALFSCGDDNITREVGARCDQKSDCEEICLVGENFPGGFCSTSCFNDDDCTGDSLCVDFSEIGVCLFSCTQSTGCEFLGPGWECVEAQSSSSEDTAQVCRGELMSL